MYSPIDLSNWMLKSAGLTVSFPSSVLCIFAEDLFPPPRYRPFSALSLVYTFHISSRFICIYILGPVDGRNYALGKIA